MLQLEKLQLEKRETIADVINLVLGAWLFLTPWIFGFVPNTAASWNAWLSGVAIGVVAPRRAAGVRRVGGVDQPLARCPGGSACQRGPREGGDHGLARANTAISGAGAIPHCER